MIKNSQNINRISSHPNMGMQSHVRRDFSKSSRTMSNLFKNNNGNGTVLNDLKVNDVSSQSEENLRNPKNHIPEVDDTLNDGDCNYPPPIPIYPQMAHPVTLQVCIVFLKVGEIDTIKERFQADAFIEISWEDNSVDPEEDFDPRNYWNPEIQIENAIGDVKQEIRYKVECVNDKILVYETRSIKGVFWERLELYDFPLGNFLKFFFKLSKILLMKIFYLNYFKRYSRFEHYYWKPA